MLREVDDKYDSDDSMSDDVDMIDAVYKSLNGDNDTIFMTMEDVHKSLEIDHMCTIENNPLLVHDNADQISSISPLEVSVNPLEESNLSTVGSFIPKQFSANDGNVDSVNSVSLDFHHQPKTGSLAPLGSVEGSLAPLGSVEKSFTVDDDDSFYDNFYTGSDDTNEEKI